MLSSSVRRVQVVDKWSPNEIALFEAAICVYGKIFDAIAKKVRVWTPLQCIFCISSALVPLLRQVGTKTTKEVIEFYYVWKKGHHYKQWKKQFVDVTLR